MDYRNWILSTVGFLGSLAATPALAADTGFYVSAGLGRAEEDPGESPGINFSLGVPPVGIVHVQPDRVEVDGGDTAWSIGVGYRFSRYIAAEVEYRDLGTTEVSEHYTVPVSPPFPPELTREYSSRMTGPALSVLGCLPVGKGFAVYARAGALFADREIATSLATDAESMTFGDTVWLGGIGVDWSFAGNWAARAEYELTGDFDSNVFAGETAAESISVRLRYQF